MKKANTNQPATKNDIQALKKDLREEMHAIEKNLRGEMHAIEKNLRGEMHAMKKDLRGEMHAMKKDLREEMLDLREGIIDQVDSKMRLYNDKVLTRLDGISKDLQDIREENAAGTLHFERLDGAVEDHEKRIVRLESTA